MTRASGLTGLAGTINSTNSTVGTTTYVTSIYGGDNLGGRGIVDLPNDDWIILSPNWSATRGAVTLVTPGDATAGNITACNRLVGTTPGVIYSQATNTPSIFGGDDVGGGGITILANSGLLFRLRVNGAIFC